MDTPATPDQPAPEPTTARAASANPASTSAAPPRPRAASVTTSGTVQPLARTGLIAGLALCVGLVLGGTAVAALDGHEAERPPLDAPRGFMDPHHGGDSWGPPGAPGGWMGLHGGPREHRGTDPDGDDWRGSPGRDARQAPDGAQQGDPDGAQDGTQDGPLTRSWAPPSMTRGS